MPRPKVPSHQRRRAEEACNFCRTSKKKCSATVPCTACERRGIGAYCYLTHKPRGGRTAGRGSVHGSGSRSSGGPGIAESMGDDGLGSSHDAPSTDRTLPAAVVLAAGNVNELLSPPQPAATDAGSNGTPSHATMSRQENQTTFTPFSGRSSGCYPNSPPASRNEQGTSPPSVPCTVNEPSQTSLNGDLHGRTLLNLRGERVYIGGAASISFLQFIRDIVSHQIGPSKFSHNESSGRMLETAPISREHDSCDTQLSFDEKIGYAKNCHIATAGLIELFTADETEALLHSADSGPGQSPFAKATADLIIAIGAQSTSPSTAKVIGRTYFHRAQQIAFEGMLQDADTDLVRVFLLMAFYMLGECRRNTAFMYLGVAARAAVALGMHTPESYTGHAKHKQLRLRTWISLCIIDMLSCSILGRPPATAGLRFEIHNDLVDCPSLTASYNILVITSDIVDELYKKPTASVAHVERLLDRVRAWSAQLPEAMRRSSPVLDGSLSQQDVVGNIHVSNLYYFAITLAARPILISTLTSRLTTGAPPFPDQASACIDAAVYLIQSCAEAHKAGYLLANMCMMKALLFAAGLVLGIVIFAERELHFEVETAFGSARELLDFLAATSPQAGHYSEILTLLYNAILKRREKFTARGRTKYVEMLFSLNSTREAKSQAEAEPLVAPDNPLLAPGMDFELDGDLLWGWDSVDLSQWDNFPFLSPRNF